MNFKTLTAAVANRLLGQMLRRALVVGVMAVCAIIALYHFTVAGNIALIGQFGDLYARLIIGAVYAAIALISLMILWAMRGKPAKLKNTPALNAQQEQKVAMLVEAVMLGYSLARKGERAR